MKQTKDQTKKYYQARKLKDKIELEFAFKNLEKRKKEIELLKQQEKEEYE